MLVAAESSSPAHSVELLIRLWPLWALAALVGLGKLLLWLIEGHRLKKSGIAQIDGMDGAAFERFLAVLFRSLGYSIEHTGRRGDYGADLVVTKNGRRTAVQAKRWSKKVGVGAIQEAVAAKAMYRCEGALVVANREFTAQARKLAGANTVELWGRESLITKLLDVRGTRDSAVVARCTVCGVEVSDKVREYCVGRPGRFGGLIYCFSHQRSTGPASQRG